ncbi:MAG TPA: hypothetical protein VFJ02_00825, partial [Vicinamibacterales bacterium]|nr:hypothetical protein [Vicinamibacterales bacterium]
LMMPKTGRPSMRNSTQTNDLGEFRVTRLGAGRYILRVRPPNQGQYYLNPASNEPPLPQPLPAYYPATQSLDQAQPIVLNRGETVTGADVVLEEGLPSVVTGMVLGLDAPQPKAAGPPANINGSVSARAAGSVEGWIETGTGIRPDGTFRFPLAPGEYILEARVSPSRPGAQPRPEDELYGSVRITVGSGPLENVAIALGAGAVATGRVIFEGSTPPPPSPGQARVPLVNPESGPGCRPPMATITEDWSFRVEGLVGTCSMQPGGAIGRWSVKSVMFRDRNLADASITFEPGQQYSNVQIIVTDKRTQVDVRVTDEAGQPTRDFVALVFPADKAKWSQIVRHLRTIVPPPVMTPNLLTPPGGGNFTVQTGIIQGGTIVPGGLGISQGSVVGLNGASRLSGMQPGDYFAIALDDIDPEDMQDPDVLEKLTTSAVRFTVGYDAPAEVPLRRWTLAEIIR